MGAPKPEEEAPAGRSTSRACTRVFQPAAGSCLVLSALSEHFCVGFMSWGWGERGAHEVSHYPGPKHWVWSLAVSCHCCSQVMSCAPSCESAQSLHPSLVHGAGSLGQLHLCSPALVTPAPCEGGVWWEGCRTRCAERDRRLPWSPQPGNPTILAALELAGSWESASSSMRGRVGSYSDLHKGLILHG